ncbi:Predicted ATPase [Actinomadura madurae]|nr:Predicted ATPase [Actinomadura madurae]
MSDVLSRVPVYARDALRAWLTNGARLELGDWEDEGLSGATVLSVLGKRPGHGPRHMIMKVLPPRDRADREPERHAWAERCSPPEFVRRHLVSIPAGFAPIPLPGNGWIMFQEIAGGSLREYRSLAKVLNSDPADLERVNATCARVVELALDGWNPAPDVEFNLYTPNAFLKKLLGHRLDTGGPLRAWAREEGFAAQIEFPGDGRLTNPIAFAQDPRLGGARRLPVLEGRCHKDLHPGNVVLSSVPGLDPSTCRFIDLSRFEEHGPLAAEPAYFLLALVAHVLESLDARQRRALAHLIADPASDLRPHVPAPLATVALTIWECGRAWAERFHFRDHWLAQWRLSLTGCGLIFGSRRRSHRQWYLHLAALAADLYTRAERGEGSTTRPAVPRSSLRLPRRLGYARPRDEQLGELKRLLREARGHPVIVHGEPGAGKSHLIVQHAHNHRGRYQTRVAWLRASPVQRLPSLLAELAETVKIPARPDILDSLTPLYEALRREGRWLLVFDDAGSPAGIEPFLPDDGPHPGLDLIITSRSPEGAGISDRSLELPRFRRDESVTLLRDRVPSLSEEEAHELAAALDDLPLAVDQAADALNGGSIQPGDYLELLRSKTIRVLGFGRAPSYRDSLSGVWSAALQSLSGRNADAEDLLTACSVFGPAPIPVKVLWALLNNRHARPAEEHSWDRLRLAAATRAAKEAGLIRAERDMLEMRTLLQAFIRDRDGTTAADLSTRARLELALAHPGAPTSPENWGSYAQLLPHALHLDLAGDDRAPCRLLLLDIAHYLTAQGDARTARAIAADAYRRWCREPGATLDSEPILLAQERLAQAHFQLGEHREAVGLDERVLEIRRARMPDHPDTLSAAHNVAVDLSALAARKEDGWQAVAERARRLHEDTIRRRREVLGPDHPDTLASVVNLSYDLYIAGDYGQARHQSGEALEALRRTVGADEPQTLRCAHRHVLDLRACGETEAARLLNADTYERRRRVLGPRHPDTLKSEVGLAADLKIAGDLPGAVEHRENALAGLRDTLGHDHLLTLQVADDLAYDLYGLDEVERARQLAADTYERRMAASGDADLDTLRSANLLLKCLQDTGDEDDVRIEKLRWQLETYRDQSGRRRAESLGITFGDH